MLGPDLPIGAPDSCPASPIRKKDESKNANIPEKEAKTSKPKAPLNFILQEWLGCISRVKTVAALSLLVGFGLMALLFYSSRMGYDEPPDMLDNQGADK